MYPYGYVCNLTKSRGTDRIGFILQLCMTDGVTSAAQLACYMVAVEVSEHAFEKLVHSVCIQADVLNHIWNVQVKCSVDTLSFSG